MTHVGMSESHEFEGGVVDIVFDGPPGPSALGGRFVEIEDLKGRSVRVGKWRDRGNGFWALRLGLPVIRSRRDLIEEVFREMELAAGKTVSSAYLPALAEAAVDSLAREGVLVVRS